jgi:hypothetical protein
MARPSSSSHATIARMTFGEAIEAMRSGTRVCRAGWNGKGMWISIQVPDEHSKMRQPYIYMSPVGGELVPWLASQSDMLAVDWAQVPMT